MIDWNDVLIEAKLIIEFLERPVFFDRPYSGSWDDAIVVTDEVTACQYSGDDEEEGFENWQSLLDQESRGAYELPKKIQNNILELIGKGLSLDKNYSSVPERLLNNMEGDMYRLLCCYAFGEVTELWKKIEDVYLKDGIPCGWKGEYPDGTIAVFSNFPSSK